MPVELKFDTDTGSWLARREINLPAIYAHASTSWKVDDPVTIFWGGRTSAELASSFFVGSVSKVVGGDPFLNIKKGPPFTSLFQTLIVTDEGPQLVSELLHKYSDSVRFVRLEHLTTISRPEYKPEYYKHGYYKPELKDKLPINADYVVWARLNEGNADASDSIGVYLAPSKIKLIITLLASFVSETSLKSITIKDAESSINELGNNLQELREK
jgi:hypothetical protein